MPGALQCTQKRELACTHHIKDDSLHKATWVSSCAPRQWSLMHTDTWTSMSQRHRKLVHNKKHTSQHRTPTPHFGWLNFLADSSRQHYVTHFTNTHNHHPCTASRVPRWTHESACPHSARPRCCTCTCTSVCIHRNWGILLILYIIQHILYAHLLHRCDVPTHKR